MRDEMDARLWGEHHEAFSTGVSRFTSRIMDVFHLLHRQRWAAPWDQPDNRRTFAVGKNLVATLGAVLFSSTMILSAVVPARTQVEMARNHQIPAVTPYLA